MTSWLDAIFPILKTFKNPSLFNILPSVWIGVTILFFLVIAYKFLSNYRRCRTILMGVRNIFSEYSPSNVLERFEEIGEKLSRAYPNDIIVHLWSEFNETLVKLKKADGTEEVFNTVDAHYFFNEERLIASRVNLRFYKAVPGILTGFGILGTFLGLSFGLGQINITSGDVQVLKEGIRGLLSGAGMAFSTSVWGIALSIVFSLLEKYPANSLRRHLSSLQDDIDKLFTRKTSEYWLADVLEESRQQSSELRKFNTDLAISIASALDEKLANRLIPTFEKFLAAIDELTRTGTAKIGETIAKGPGTEIEKLTDVLSKVGITLETTVKKSQEIQEQMGTALDDQLNKISNTITVLISGLSKEISTLVNKAEDQTKNSSEEMKKHLEELSNLIQSRTKDVSQRFEDERLQVGELLRQMESAMEKAKEIIEDASLAADTFSQIATPLEKGSDNLLDAIAEMRASQKRFAETVDLAHNQFLQQTQTAEETFKHMRDALEITRDSWKAYETRFGGIRGDLEAVFEELGGGLREYKEETGKGVIEYLSKLDGSFKDTIGLLSGAIEELGETIEDLGDILPKGPFRH
jgi:gas vesicle protein